MSSRLVAASMLISASVLSGRGVADPAGVSSMDAYMWLNRPLLVFAPTESDPIIAEQRSALAGRSAALRDRDMIVIEIAGDRVTIDGAETRTMTATALRDRYGVGRDAALVLLVGKDGGVKLRQSRALSSRDLFETIDAMPMRRREMGEPD